MKSESVYLRHILECIRRVEEDVAGGQGRFLASHTVQDAVLRNLQTMAESTQRLSDSLKATQASVEWHRIGAFRNLLVHNYLGIDLNVVWEIVQRDVPELKRATLEMLDYVEGRASRN
jgi:uncharacterized protein with HEPN domain